MRVLLMQKPGKLFSAVPLLKVMIRTGDVLTAKPESLKESSEPSLEPVAAKSWNQHLGLFMNIIASTSNPI